MIDCLLLPEIPCAGYSLNLAVQDGLDVQEVHTALARAKKIVTHFYKSRLDCEALKSKQKQLGLSQHDLPYSGNFWREKILANLASVH